jgi:transketolase
MRNAFAEELRELAVQDETLVLLSGDIGNRMFDRMKELCPGRFFNCGIAEGNMVSMAAGMALCGLRPIAYTIAPFITARCLEQIRLDVCYQKVPVILVGTGAGLSYASLNATHHSCEDIASLRVLPNMTVLCPGDAEEVRLALRAAIEHRGPVYIRIGKKGEPVVHKKPPEFEIGKWITMDEPGEICLLSTGNLLPLAMEVNEQLVRRGVKSGVVSCHTVKPLDRETLEAVFSHSRLVVTLEEHSILGGFGGAVAEWLAETPKANARLLRQGTTDVFLYEAGDQEHARERYNLTPSAVVDNILAQLDGSCSE